MSVTFLCWIRCSHYDAIFYAQSLCTPLWLQITVFNIIIIFLTRRYFTTVFDWTAASFTKKMLVFLISGAEQPIRLREKRYISTSQMYVNVQYLLMFNIINISNVTEHSWLCTDIVAIARLWLTTLVNILNYIILKIWLIDWFIALPTGLSVPIRVQAERKWWKLPPTKTTREPWIFGNCCEKWRKFGHALLIWRC
jgi:hypothetical protein